jgi:hypothetical protein
VRWGGGEKGIEAWRRGPFIAENWVVSEKKKLAKWTILVEEKRRR